MLDTHQSQPVQFAGETPWDAIVHHKGLDMVDEDSFRRWLEAPPVGIDPDRATLRELSDRYEEWLAAPGGA